MKQLKTIRIFAIAVIMAHEAGAVTTNLAALIPDEKKFQAVLEEIRDQTGPGYHINVIDVNKKMTVNAIAGQCKSLHVAGLILMDYKAINTALALQQYDSAFKAMPKFVFMTLLADLTARGLSNTAGITFEVPLYTLVTNFRIISQKDFSRIGIFYRSSFARSVEESKKLLEREQIRISAVCVDCDQGKKPSIENTLRIMNDSLDKLVSDEKVEAFIIPADNIIVNSKSLAEFWNRKIKGKRIPVIATIDLLASEKFGTAVFAADPDLMQLGAQAANLIVEHFENNMPMEKIGFEPTISIKSTLNEHVAGEISWKLKNEKLGRITTIINY
ncbi:MAG: hypothetical protein WBM07_12285 [Chitinivibrionales bacterium]